jgi:uncharacterized protein (DUF302 family)
MQGVLTLESPHPFARTVERLVSEFQAHGVKVFAVIDQQAEAAASGIDLPLKAFVSEAEPGKVVVNLNAADYVIERHALPSRLSANLAPAERLVMNALRA